MKFELTEEQIMIQQAARDFAQNELLPGVIERDEHQKFPAAQVKKMGELGFLGMMVSPKYGGGGLDTISYVLAYRPPPPYFGLTIIWRRRPGYH